MKFGVCDFSRLAFTDWRLRRWRLCFLALMTATHLKNRIIYAFAFLCVLNFLYVIRIKTRIDAYFHHDILA